MHFITFVVKSTNRVGSEWEIWIWMIISKTTLKCEIVITWCSIRFTFVYLGSVFLSVCKNALFHRMNSITLPVCLYFMLVLSSQHDKCLFHIALSSP